MKTRLLSATFVAGLAIACSTLYVGGLSSHVEAQTGRAPSHGDVVVIDIPYILKNHRRFDAAKDQLTEQFKAKADGLEKEKNEIMELQKSLSKYNPGTPEYSRLDEEVARRQADWNVKANRHRKEITDQQAAILGNVYYEITNTVKNYCAQNGIQMVIQFNGEPVDPGKPFDAAKAITRPLVYVAPNRDITPNILGMINQGGGQPATNAANRAAPGAAGGQFAPQR